MNIEEVIARILGKRGKANEEWIRTQDPWDLSPINVRDETLLECANIVMELRDSFSKEKKP